MKLYATLINSKGKKEGMGDNEKIIMELSHKNHYIGTIELRSYAANGWILEGWSIGDKEGLCMLFNSHNPDGTPKTRQKQQGKKWLFDHGGECKRCHRVEITELNKQNICFECFK